MTEVNLKLGEEYLLSVDEKSMQGRYIGFNPAVTLPFFRIEQPEGNVFVTLNEGDLEIYCDRSSNRGIAKLLWHSDGDDGPCWPAGTSVEKPHTPLRESERDYLLNIIKKQEAKAA